jgi:Fur family zinc uptake transcriptional regulator
MAQRKVLAAFKPTAHDHGACIEGALAAAERLCTERGLRLTPVRRRVLELVWQRHAPIGAYEVLDLMRGDGRRVDPPTVYRALDFLRETGLVHRLESLNAYVGCSEPEAGHAGQFLICRDCRRVAEIEDPEIARTIDASAGRLGFRVGRQTVEVTGLCRDCRSAGGGPGDARA